MPQGVIVGVARITDVDVFGPHDDIPENHPIVRSPWAEGTAAYLLCLADPEPCMPVDFKGKVGLFKVPYDAAASLESVPYDEEAAKAVDEGV